MEDLVTRLGWKKLVAIMVVLSILFLVTIFFLSSSPQTKSPSPLSEDENTKDLVVPTSNLPQETNTTAWPRYESNFFSFQHPQEYSVKPEYIEQVGDAASIESQVKDQHIGVQVYDSSKTSVDRLTQVFNAYGFTKRNTTIAGLPAVVFQGEKNHVTPNLQETVVVFEKNSKVYKIQMSYSSNEVDPEIEKTFTEIISTLTLP